MTPARVATLTPLIRNPKKVAQRLIDAGLWTVLDDGSYRVCDCLDDLRTAAGRGDEQPSTAFIVGERERARERKDKFRNKHRKPDGNADENGVPTTRRNSSQHSADQSRAAQSSAVQEGTASPFPALAQSIDEPDDDLDGPLRTKAEAVDEIRNALSYQRGRVRATS